MDPSRRLPVVRMRRAVHRVTARKLLVAMAVLLLTIAAAGVGLHVGARSALATDDPKCVDNRAACGTIIVSLTGYGTGLWTTTSTLNGAPDGRISCGIQYGQISGTCRAMFFVGTAPGQTRTVYVHVEAAADSKPDGSGTQTLHAGETIRATQIFDHLHDTVVWVHLDGTGSGTVTSDPPNINCPAGCTWGYSDEVVTLTAVANPGSVFAHWGDDCAAFVGPVCAVNATGPATIFPRAVFNVIATPSPVPSPTAKPSPSPKVTPTPTKSPVPTRTPAVTGSSSPTLNPTSSPVFPSAAPSGTTASTDPSSSPVGSPLPTPAALATPTSTVPASASPSPSVGPSGEPQPAASTTDGSGMVTTGVLAGVAVLVIGGGLFWLRRRSRRQDDRAT